MTVNKIKRKLTTIFCADVQSYSALMAGDEADTLARLQRYRTIMGDFFERHEGRKVNTWGDAVIAEFPSVVEAVRCAVEIQDAIGAENRDLPKPKQMWFRIGINLGDVMEDGSDLYGDGVNVAARLESIADPGGIMVSETVYNLTNRHLAFGYDFAGQQKVKGQDDPIPSYRVRMPGQNAEARETAAGDEIQPELTRSPPASHATSAPPEAGPAKGGMFGLGRLRKWFWKQAWTVRGSIFMIGMFAVINLLTNGFSEVWFVYPSIPFVFFLVVRGLGKRA
jgi:adenylate cyclase